MINKQMGNGRNKFAESAQKIDKWVKAEYLTV